MADIQKTDDAKVNIKKTEETNSDVFITENDTFDIVVKYYRKDGNMFVKNIDDNFDDTVKDIKSIVVTMKYPSQGDSMIIERIKSNDSGDVNDIKTFLRLEYNRFVVLARKWNLPEKLEEGQILNLHPKIVKGIFHVVREKIGLDGLL